MSENQNWDNYGEKFKNAVQDAISGGNFEPLNGLVNDTVEDVISEAKVQFGAQKEKRTVHYEKTTSYSSSHVNHRSSESMYSSRQTTQEKQPTKDMRRQPRGRYDFRRTSDEQADDKSGRRSYDFRRNSGESLESQNKPGVSNSAGYENVPKANNGKLKEYPDPAKRSRAVALFKRNGIVSGTLFQVFGGIGFGLGVITFLTFLCMFLFMKLDWLVTAFLIAGFFSIGFGVMIKCGNLLKGRLKRAQRYLELCGKNKYINISELSDHTGKSQNYVRKDVRKMLDKGIFPQGHMDDKETCLILDDETFKQYRQLEMQKTQYLEQSKTERSLLLENTGNNTNETLSENEQLNEMVKEGHDCILRLREMNDRIEGDVISNKLFRLENVLKEIFERLKMHPELMPRMHKVMGYYLPTTLKLVAAYEEFDKMSVQGPQILDAKAEIENTLDSINSAFGEILNTLFVDSAFDAATDAQVLKSMLEREGLTGGMPTIDLQAAQRESMQQKEKVPVGALHNEELHEEKKKREKIEV